MGLPLIFDLFRKKKQMPGVQSIVLIAIRSLEEKYPLKFPKQLRFEGSVRDETITLLGNFNINKREIYKRIIDLNGEKEEYTIILKKA